VDPPVKKRALSGWEYQDDDDQHAPAPPPPSPQPDTEIPVQPPYVITIPVEEEIWVLIPGTTTTTYNCSCDGKNVADTTRCDDFPSPNPVTTACSINCTYTITTYINITIDNCGLEPWSSWSTCSKNCGTGTQYRTRTCNCPNANKRALEDSRHYRTKNRHEDWSGDGYGDGDDYGDDDDSHYQPAPQPSLHNIDNCYTHPNCSGACREERYCNVQACPPPKCRSEWRDTHHWPRDAGETQLPCHSHNWRSIVNRAPQTTWEKLASEWVTARLNLLNGAVVPEVVLATMKDAEEVINDGCIYWNSGYAIRANRLGRILWEFNNPDKSSTSFMEEEEAAGMGMGDLYQTQSSWASSIILMILVGSIVVIVMIGVLRCNQTTD